MESPLLSIALTTYNHEAFIEKTLESILHQSVDFEYEIVIGEDGSKDRTRAIVLEHEKRFPNKIRVLSGSENLGYVKNFDRTLKSCGGKYIAVFDGDDIMLPGKLRKQVDFMEAHPEFVMSGHDVRAFDSESGRTEAIYKPHVRRDFYTIEDLIIYGSFIANSSKMFRRESVPPEGTDPRIHAVSDWYLTLKIVGEGKIGYIHEVLADYRIRRGSMMRTLRGRQDFEDKVLTLEMLDRTYNGKYNHLFNYRMAYAHLIYAIDELRNGNVSSAREKILKSIREKPNYTKGQFYYLFLTYAPAFLRRRLLG